MPNSLIVKLGKFDFTFATLERAAEARNWLVIQGILPSAEAFFVKFPDAKLLPHGAKYQ